MSGGCGDILNVLAPVKTFVYDNMRDYVGYVGNCEGNLRSLQKNLSDVCNKKEDISKMVKEGEDKLERITREAASWLKDVRLLTREVELKCLMYKDIETAKFVIKLMGKKDLKKLVREDGDMQQLVVEVMDMLKEEMDKSEDEMRLIAKEDYKRMAEIVVEVMKDTTEEFKKLMKKNKQVAVMATRMLKDSDLDKLTKDDKEMEDIFREAGSVSDEEDSCQNDVADNEEADVSKIPEVVAVNENVLLKAVKRLLIPLENLLSLAGKLMDDADFKDAVPEAKDVKLGLDVIDNLLLQKGGFKKAMDENTRQHESSCCCFCAFVPSYYHNRYKMSISAVTLAKRIKNDILEKCPGHPLTVCIRSIDVKRNPTQFLEGLPSRDRLLQDILKILRDDQVNAVGLYGMGGCGKTTLAKEVACKCVDMYIIMVEITESPDIRRIQGTIAESIGLPLGVQNIAQRATELYNRLISEKKKKILIILDNIWEKLDLDDVGIPGTCKLLLTTREEEVCRLMGVRADNTRQVGLLDATEGKGLFHSQAGDKWYNEEHKTLIDRLLSKCGGLPLAIVVTANALKDKDLPNWRLFADDLEKPLSFQLTSGDHRATNSILLTSYRFMQSKEKRMFFLLCCLWCFDSHIPIKALMKCGIGLDLFQHVNKLSEAMNQADRWAEELMSSSLLLKSDIPGYLKIHDVVRTFGISFAAKDDGHMLLVDAIPRWMNKKTLTEYTAISLLSHNDYSRLIGMESDKLQILLLRNTVIPDSPSSYSGTMTNLEVLNLRNMNFLHKLPESIGKLMKLRTLSLEFCTLGDIKAIGELVNLSVLNLRDSLLEELPNEIGKLINLRLLDLTNCICKLRRPDLANILGRLSELEGLFMFNIIFKDGGTSYAPLALEFNNLHYLNALEMQICCPEQLSVDSQFVKNLYSFRTCISYRMGNHSNAPQVGSFRCLLDVEEIDMGKISGKRTFKALLKKADWLRLHNTSNFSYLFDKFDNEGLPELRRLEVDSCRDVTFIVNLRWNLLVFPILHSLTLHNLPELKGFCDGEAPPGILSNLQHLSILGLKNLQYVLPFARAPCKLTEIKVGMCESLKFIFIANSIGDGRHAEMEETYVLELPLLKLLDLSYLDHFVCLLGSENLSDIGDGVQELQVFFNPRIVFSSLEEFSLSECKRIVKLWDKDLGISSFRSLRTIKIVGCERLSSVGSLSIFSALLRLVSLTIEGCESMHEVITTEGTGELENHEQVVIFPQLKDLVIGSSSNLKSFYGGICKLEFPILKYLSLSNLDRLDKFSGSENRSILFHKEMDFPCLEELKVSYINVEVTGLWNWHPEGGSTHLSNVVPMLRKLTVIKTKRWRQIPSIIYKNLSFLKFEKFNDEMLLSLGNEGSVWTYSQLPKLKDLCVKDGESLKDLLRSEDFEAAAALTFCEQLKNLRLIHLPRLKIFPLRLFKSLCSLRLQGLSWHYAFSADIFVKLQESLQHLETLEIRECKNMRVVIQDDGEGDTGLVFKFPRLKEIIVSSSSIIGFSNTVNATLCLPSLEKIEIYGCDAIQHFWSGPIIAPKLEEMTVKECSSIKSVLVGNPNHMVELPSLTNVWLSGCPNVLCFSSAPLTAPNLDYAICEGKKYSMAEFEMNLNRLLQSCYTTSSARQHSAR